MSIRGIINIRTEPEAVSLAVAEGCYVRIDRGSKWGNPYSHRYGTLAKWVVSSRAEAIARYEEYVRSRPDLIAALPELDDKILGCWCMPLACHGQVLARLVEEFVHERSHG
jgi:hypothetical protein